MKKRIFITGGLGRIGSCIAEGLEQSEEYEVLLGTRGEGDGKKIIHVDFSDPQSLIDALKGVHTVIHLGFYMKNDNFSEEHIDSNLKGAFYLYEAARINGVNRVIFGSSNHVFGFYKKGEKITSDSPYRPDSNYGLTKVFVEVLGRYYSDRYGISCINVRIGNFTTNGNKEPFDERITYIWLSNTDCQQLFRKCIEYDENCKYLNMFGMSANSGCYFDTSDNAVIGYEPQTDGAVYRGETKGENVINPYHGYPTKMMTAHDYVGGYNVLLDKDGKVDIDFLHEIMKEKNE